VQIGRPPKDGITGRRHGHGSQHFSVKTIESARTLRATLDRYVLHTNNPAVMRLSMIAGTPGVAATTADVSVASILALALGVLLLSLGLLLGSTLAAAG
jgi:hypothetical protein